MKYCVKKLYCPNCQRLVGCIEETREGHLHAICPRCQSSIRIRDGIHWKVPKSSVKLEKETPTKRKKKKKTKEEKETTEKESE